MLLLCLIRISMFVFLVGLQPSSFTLTSLSFDCQYRVRVWPTISSVDTGLSSAGGAEQSNFGPARARPLRPTRFRGSRSASDDTERPASSAVALALDPAAALSSLQASSSSGSASASASASGPAHSQAGRFAGRARSASVGAAGAAGGGGGRGGRVREGYTRQIRTNGAGVSFYLNFSEIRFVTPSCDRMRSLPPAIFCPKRVHLERTSSTYYYVQYL